MVQLIVPFDETGEITDDPELHNFEPILTDLTPAEITATQTRYATEYSQQKLNDIHGHLWIAGMKEHYHALHYQKVLRRKIVLSERSDLHLVWYGHVIHIQPLPNRFLNHNFMQALVCPDPALYSNFHGFLYSYTKLIQHPFDLSLLMS